MIRPADGLDRAHLTGRSAPSPPVSRYQPDDDLTDVVQRFWVPVWDVPKGVTWQQKVLQHPICLIVVASSYARFYGVVTGLSTVELSGQGWAFGTMLRPAAGRLLWQRSVATLTNRHVDLREVPALDGAGLAAQITALMAPAPADPARHRCAIEVVQEQLRGRLPVGESGQLVNTVVATIDSLPTSARVEELAAAVGLSSRGLQRLTREHLGLTPKWLVQRRRLHQATERLKSGELPLADLAHELGYADQAHLTRDFTRFTGMTPGAYMADQPSVRSEKTVDS